MSFAIPCSGCSSLCNCCQRPFGIPPPAHYFPSFSLPPFWIFFSLPDSVPWWRAINSSPFLYKPGVWSEYSFACCACWHDFYAYLILACPIYSTSLCLSHSPKRLRTFKTVTMCHSYKQWMRSWLVVAIPFSSALIDPSRLAERKASSISPPLLFFLSGSLL